MTVTDNSIDIDNFFKPTYPPRIPEWEKEFEETAEYKIIKIPVNNHKEIIEKRIRKNLINGFKLVPDLPKYIYAMEFLPSRDVQTREELVLCCHGWEGRGANFLKFIPKLQEEGYRVISLDFPKHGRTQEGIELSGCTVFGHTLNAVIRSLNIPLIIIAHSMGNGAFDTCYRLSNIEEISLIKRYVGIGVMNRYYDAVIEHVKMFKYEDEEGLVQSYCERKAELFGVDVFDIECGKEIHKMDIPILIVHDTKDKEIPVEKTRVLKNCMKKKTYTIGDKVYPSYHETTGLGHRRILRDENVVKLVVDFISKGK